MPVQRTAATEEANLRFDAARAYASISHQVGLGPRVPGTDASRECAQYFHEAFSTIGPVVDHNYTIRGVECQNVIAKLAPGSGRDVVIFAAHYDSRAVAEKDSTNTDQPIDGANDGASGAAVIIELARTLKLLEVNLTVEVWFVFFDAEDQGLSGGMYGISGWNWCEGSEVLAQNLTATPEWLFGDNRTLANVQALILLDMVGGPGLEFIHEARVNLNLMRSVFGLGRELGYASAFPENPRYQTITDDHVPFATRGISTLDLIIPFWDLTHAWPHHHTQQDTLENIDVASLNATGRTLEHWIHQNYLREPINGDGGDWPPPGGTDWGLFGQTLLFISVVALGITVIRHARRSRPS
jgi:Zn-dependent M28 family amino/carboxypeptidase